MRMIDADELKEHVWRESLDTREKISDLIDRQPTLESTDGLKKLHEAVLILVLLFLIVLFCVVVANPVQAKEKQPELIKVETTGYYDYLYHWGIGYDGRKLVENLTVAGKKEWLGMSCALYDMDFRLIGIYEFRDIGYGKSLGYGKSQVIKGKSLGDIEAGKTIDIYFKNKSDALAWGRQTCYMQLIKAVG